MGMYRTVSSIALISSILPVDAASISIMSGKPPLSIATQFSHVPHGSSEVLLRQFTAFARIRAREVFPTPRGPVKRYAWAIRPNLREFFMVVTMWGCPITSSNFFGLHLRAITV
jgi:hypothetical protein